MVDSDDEDILYANDLGRNLIGGKREKTVDDVLNGDKKDKRKLRKTLALCMAFLCLGLCLAILGPTLLSLQQHLHTTLPKISWVFAGRSIGYLSGAILGGMLFETFNPLFLLAVCLLLCGIGIVIAPFVTTVMFLAICISSVGISMGVLDTGANVLCLRMWGKKRSGTMLQALHFSFAVGAFIAPLVAAPFLVETNSAVGAVGNASFTPSQNLTVALTDVNQTSRVKDGDDTSLVKNDHIREGGDGKEDDEKNNSKMKRDVALSAGKHESPTNKNGASGKHQETLKKRTQRAAASTQKAPASSPKAAASTQKAPASSPKAAASTQKAPVSTPKAAASTQKAPASTQKVAASTQKAAASTKKAPASTQKAPASTQKALASTQKAAASTQKAPASTQKAPASTQKAPATTQKAAASTQKAAASTQKTTASTPAVAASTPTTPASTPTTGGSTTKTMASVTTSPSPPQHQVERFAIAYIIIGVLVLVNSGVFFYFLCTKPKHEPQYIGSDQANSTSDKNNFPFRTRILILLFFFYFLYVGGEVAYGSFVSVFASKSHYQFEQDRASHVAAVFWGIFSLGRGLAICLASVISPLKMVIMDMVGCVATSLALTLFADRYENVLWIGSALLGLSMASLFPSGIAWLESYTPVTGNTASFLIVGSALGEMCVPVVIGYLFNQSIPGPMVLMYWMLATSGLSLFIFIYVMWLVMENGQEKKSLPAEKSPALELFQSVEEALPMEELFKNSGSNGKQMGKARIPPILKKKDHRE